MKCFLFLVLIALGGLFWWTYRARVRLAFKAATIGYIAILAINIVRFSSDEENTQSMVVMLGGGLLLWLVLWVGVTAWNKYKASSTRR
ncbi:MAG: hypothetical protein ACYC3S_13840 [Chloroflexota bacterium]